MCLPYSFRSVLDQSRDCCRGTKIPFVLTYLLKATKFYPFEPYVAFSWGKSGRNEVEVVLVGRLREGWSERQMRLSCGRSRNEHAPEGNNLWLGANLTGKEFTRPWQGLTMILESTNSWQASTVNECKR